MLERDLLITLHLRIRLIATRELKVRVRERRREALVKRAGRSKAAHTTDPQQPLEELDLDTTHLSAQSITSFPWLSLSSKATRRHARRTSSIDDARDFSGLIWPNKGDRPIFDEDEDGGSSIDGAESGWESSEDSMAPTVIEDPGRATPLQRRWLSAMSEGKDIHISKRFALYDDYIFSSAVSDV